jgi:hypothetical protein
VNFVGHIATGLRVSDGRERRRLLVGAALPDFAAMGGIRLGAPDGSLGRGIALHHASDHAFHADRWFLDVERDLRASLNRDGLPDGAARACAHVGPELLLDGALLAEPAIARGVGRVYEAIAEPSVVIVDLVPHDERPHWRAHLMSVARRLDPLTYRDPSVVAQRLHAVTARRPRLAFDEHLVPTVMRTMAAVQPWIVASAHDVLGRVAAVVRATPRRNDQSGGK